MMSFTDRMFFFVIPFGLLGTLVFGVPGAAIGCCLGIVVGSLLWWRDRSEAKAHAKEWLKLYCPRCRLVTGSVGKCFIGKKTKMSCPDCKTNYEVEVEGKHFGLGE